MSRIRSDDEVRKIAFLREYRALCEKYDMLVYPVPREADEAWQEDEVELFVLATEDAGLLEDLHQELLVNPVLTDADLEDAA